MSLYSSERHVDHHRPDIADSQEYTNQKRGSDYEAKEKYARKMENNPDSTIYPYDVIEVFE